MKFHYHNIDLNELWFMSSDLHSMWYYLILFSTQVQEFKLTLD